MRQLFQNIFRIDYAIAERNFNRFVYIQSRKLKDDRFMKRNQYVNNYLMQYLVKTL